MKKDSMKLHYITKNNCKCIYDYVSIRQGRCSQKKKFFPVFNNCSPMACLCLINFITEERYLGELSLAENIGRMIADEIAVGEVHIIALYLFECE